MQMCVSMTLYVLYLLSTSNLHVVNLQPVQLMLIDSRLILLVPVSLPTLEVDQYVTLVVHPTSG